MQNCDSFKAGWGYASSCLVCASSVHIGNTYIDTVASTIQKLNDDMNQYSGRLDNIETLRGFVAENWHNDTYNINAALQGIKNRAERYNSNRHASPDITLNFSDNINYEYSLKWYATAQKSVNAQATSIIESYQKYCNQPRQSKPITFEQYLEKHGYSSSIDIYKSIYNGQGRIIPSDQLDEAIDFLRQKIISDSISNKPSRIAIMQNRLETLKQLSDRIKDNAGVESLPLTNDESKVITALCKEGEFESTNFGISIEMITIKYLVQQSLKAGTTAAVISLVLQLAPELYQLINHLITNGEIDLDQLRTMGSESLSNSTKSFLKGSIACGLTIACKTGKLGTVFTQIDPILIGNLTVILVDTCIYSFLVAVKKITPRQFGSLLTKEIIISTISIPAGLLGQSLLPQLPVIGYMLGSFLGSTICGLSIKAGEQLLLSFCVDSGFACFGLVNQNYTLPTEILQQMGVNINDIPQKTVAQKVVPQKQILRKSIGQKQYRTLDIIVLERGIIGVNSIGYI